MICLVSFTGKTRKRKPSESEQSSPKPRTFKEDVENKQTSRRSKLLNRHLANKKKVLEETNNSKQVREIEIRVEDCSSLCKQKLEETNNRSPADRPDSVPGDDDDDSNGRSSVNSARSVSANCSDDVAVQCCDDVDVVEESMPVVAVDQEVSDDCISVIVVPDSRTSSCERSAQSETSDEIDTREQVDKPARNQDRECSRGKWLGKLTFLKIRLYCKMNFMKTLYYV